MIAQVNLANLQLTLERLADECITLGTPFAVRRKIKAAIAALPAIEEARKKC